MLKCDFHSHSRGDPIDGYLKYSAEALIDMYAQHDYDVCALTWHEGYGYTDSLAEYAKDKGVLLLSGQERTIEGAHVLLLNFSKAECDSILTLDHLRRKKKEDNLVIAPHPYYPMGCSLRDQLDKNIDVFDAIEWSYFFSNILSWNKQAAITAKEHGKPLVATGDVHALWQVGKSYTWVDAKPTAEGVIRAVKEGKVEHVPPPFFRQIPQQVLLATWGNIYQLGQDL
ncbi:MAG: PHP-associated domain-containing protein [Candidatus Woesearchaeota archaeon]|jgi:hypothetical protein|nr:PHP-associated domain-containing protein [Candidatus Woesearchaeota archaeon]MDP7181675.1 PHP-associated domain-containing protein [Candidatus Woesearchaeota archaeon]MDP7198764.1 PHP-associated domain-containing protein [Candidatus Woesearchaeota archaeon]MDP7467236.1 PHP-associated domain-containing protein [Candidatus Woesearchaeota archaeon]MDP7647429.1 PHP-associated domain-containing protein [Candidatus Woesearchaeota archaeon]